MCTSLYSYEYVFHELWFTYAFSKLKWFLFKLFLPFLYLSCLIPLSGTFSWTEVMRIGALVIVLMFGCDGSCLLFLCMLYHVHVISFYFFCHFFFLKWHGALSNVFFCLRLHWGHWRKIFYSLSGLVSGGVYNWGNFGLFVVWNLHDWLHPLANYMWY